jgi:hypothetical protein
MEKDPGPQPLLIFNLFSTCHSAEDPRPQLLPILTLFSTCHLLEDPGPQLIANIWQLVFLKRTPDPICSQDFNNLYFCSRPQIPAAGKNEPSCISKVNARSLVLPIFTHFSTCHSEEDPRPQMLSILISFSTWHSVEDPGSQIRVIIY